MSNEQINTIAAAVSTLTLLLVAYQVWQVNVWNRRQSSFNFIDTDRGRLLERDLDEALRSLGIDLMVRRNQPLTDDEILRIRKSGEAATAVNHFTNDLQNLCAALRYKLVDTAVFRSIHAGRIRWWYRLLAPYVAAMRSELDDPQLWEDFQRVAATRSSEGSFAPVAARRSDWRPGCPFTLTVRGTPWRLWGLQSRQPLRVDFGPLRL